MLMQAPTLNTGIIEESFGIFGQDTNNVSIDAYYHHTNAVLMTVWPTALRSKISRTPRQRHLQPDAMTFGLLVRLAQVRLSGLQALQERSCFSFLACRSLSVDMSCRVSKRVERHMRSIGEPVSF